GRKRSSVAASLLSAPPGRGNGTACGARSRSSRARTNLFKGHFRYGKQSRYGRLLRRGGAGADRSATAAENRDHRQGRGAYLFDPEPAGPRAGFPSAGRGHSARRSGRSFSPQRYGDSAEILCDAKGRGGDRHTGRPSAGQITAGSVAGSRTYTAPAS